MGKKVLETLSNPGPAEAARQEMDAQTGGTHCGNLHGHRLSSPQSLGPRVASAGGSAGDDRLPRAGKFAGGRPLERFTGLGCGGRRARPRGPRRSGSGPRMHLILD